MPGHVPHGTFCCRGYASRSRRNILARNALTKRVQFQHNAPAGCFCDGVSKGQRCGRELPRIEECSTRNTCAEPSAWPVEGRLAQNLADADFETPHFLLATQWRQRSPAHGRNGGRYVPRETSVTHAGGLESGKDQTTLLYEQVYELDG